MCSSTYSILSPLWAEMGMMGDFSAMVYLVKRLMASNCSLPSSLLLSRSILFWRMMSYFMFMMSIADRCSHVCGCGHFSLAAIKRRQASMTAAPFSMVAMSTSCPGQSTKLMWRLRISLDWQFLHTASSSFCEEPKDW